MVLSLVDMPDMKSMDLVATCNSYLNEGNAYAKNMPIYFEKILLDILH